MCCSDDSLNSLLLNQLEDTSLPDSEQHVGFNSQSAVVLLGSYDKINKSLKMFICKLILKVNVKILKAFFFLFLQLEGELR